MPDEEVVVVRPATQKGLHVDNKSCISKGEVILESVSVKYFLICFSLFEMLSQGNHKLRPDGSTT